MVDESICTHFKWSDCAVLTCTHNTLNSIRACLEYHKIPVTWSLPKNKTPPLFRIREIAGFIEKLKPYGQELMKAGDIEKHLDDFSGSEKSNPWFSLIRGILRTWKEETAGAEFPVKHFIEHLYESLTEQKRSFQFGEGVFLSTVHAAKGMEFPHVFIPDGGWKKGTTSDEEERRLFYVAMTRAQRSLCLFKRSDQENPHLSLFQKDFLMHRTAESQEKQLPQSIIQQRYDILGMRDIFLDYAGSLPPHHPVHRNLVNLKAGTILNASMGEKDKRVRLLNGEGHSVAMLSHSTTQKWLHRLSKILDIRVIAMIRREKTDIKEKEFQKRCLCEQWEVPIVEIIYHESTARS